MPDSNVDSKISAFMQVFLGRNNMARTDASEALARLGTPVIPFMLKVLSDRDESFFSWTPWAKDRERILRSTAVWVLGEIGDPTVVPLLTRIVADKDENQYVRFHSGVALGKIGEASAVPALTQAIVDTYGSPDAMDMFIHKSALDAYHQVRGDEGSPEDDDEEEFG